MPVEVIKDPIVFAEPSEGVSGEDIMARRRALFAKYEESTAEGKIDLEAATKQPEAPREQIESVLVKTPAGEIEFGPPPGVSITLRMAQMMGEKNPNRYYMVLLRTLMCVRKIDGKAVTPVTSEVEAQYLANLLGDDALNYLFEVLIENWPPPQPGDLQILKKSPRRLT